MLKPLALTGALALARPPLARDGYEFAWVRNTPFGKRVVVVTVEPGESAAKDLGGITLGALAAQAMSIIPSWPQSATRSRRAGGHLGRCRMAMLRMPRP